MNDLTIVIEQLRENGRQYIRHLGVLKPYSVDNITITQFNAMIELQSKPIEVTEMARLLKIDKSNASRALKQLENKGLVESYPSELDGRKKLSTLTEKGLKRVREIDLSISQKIDKALQTLSDEECQLILQGMNLYIKALQETHK